MCVLPPSVLLLLTTARPFAHALGSEDRLIVWSPPSCVRLALSHLVLFLFSGVFVGLLSCRLLQFLRENAITRMLFTPSLLQLVMDQCDPDALREGMKTMRIVWLCGEVVTVELR